MIPGERDLKSKTLIISILIIALNLYVLIDTPDYVKAQPRYPINSFNSGVSIGLPTYGNYDCIGVADVNRDGYDDFVSGQDDNSNSSSKGLFYFASNGDGSWNQTAITSLNSWAGIEITDTDGDGNDEVFACHTESSSSIGVGVWEWTGSGFTQSGVTSPYTSDGVNYINIKNITGDSSLDVVIANYDRGIKYFEGDGSWGWTEYSTGLPTWGLYTQSAVADFNKDGRLDIVAGNYGNGLKFYTQDISGTSWTDQSNSLPSAEKSGNMMGVTAGDVNEDGNMDVIFCRFANPNGLFLLLGNGGGSNGTDFKWTYLNNSWSTRPPGRFYQMHLNDVDLDGDLDLLAAKENSGLHLYLGNGSETPGLNFGWSEVLGKGLPTTMIFFGSNYLDFDNDGDLDVAGCTNGNPIGNGIFVYENNLTLPDVPVPRAGADQIVIIGNTVHLDGTNSTDPQDCPAGDVTGTLLTYDWNFTSQPVGSTMGDSDLSPSDNVANPSFVPTHVGNYTLSLRVQDTENHWSVAVDFIKITVLFVNTRPIADAGNDQQVYVNTLVNLNGSSSFDNEDSFDLLLFDWNVSSGNPAVVTLNDETVVKPTFMAPMTTGQYQFTLRVQDSLGLWSLEDIVNVTVSLTLNTLPVAHAGEDFMVYSNQTAHLNGSGSNDPDGYILTWDWNCSSHQSIIFINENSSTPYFIPEMPDIYIITLTVKDDRGAWAVEDSVVVTVIEQNLKPISDAGEDFSVYSNETATLNGTLSYDPDGSILTWEWKCINDLTLVMQNINSSKPSFIPNRKMVYSFTLQIKDDLGLWSDMDFVNVTVQDRPVAINTPPNADAGENIVVYVNSTVLLNGSKSYDGDGNIISWDWNCTTHDVVFNNENSSNPSFFVSEIGNYEITLRVLDDSGAWSLEDQIIVTALAKTNNNTNDSTNHAPEVKIISPVNGDILTNSTIITWSASDPENEALSFTIELLNADNGFIITLVSDLESTARSWQWNTKTQTNAEYRIRIIASDGKLSDQDTSGVFTIKNQIIPKDVKDDDKSRSDNFLSNNLIILGFILLIIIVIIILIFLLIFRSQKRPVEQAPNDRQIYPVSEPLDEDIESTTVNGIESKGEEQQTEFLEEPFNSDEVSSISSMDTYLLEEESPSFEQTIEPTTTEPVKVQELADLSDDLTIERPMAPLAKPVISNLEKDTEISTENVETKVTKESKIDIIESETNNNSN